MKFICDGLPQKINLIHAAVFQSSYKLCCIDANIVLHKYKLIIVSVTYQQINKGEHKMKFVKYENFAAIKKYIWTENMSKKDQDLSLLF